MSLIRAKHFQKTMEIHQISASLMMKKKNQYLNDVDAIFELQPYR